MKKIRISELPLSESTKGLYLLATDKENKSVKVSMDSMSEEVQAKIQDARAIADEGLDKADSALWQIHEERQERAAQDRTLAEAVSQERAARTAADAELQARISILIPSAMTVEAPKRITWGNVFPVSIKAVLSPVTAMRNLIYISDNKAVEVSTDGVLTPVTKGVSRVHVIPTLNTAIARTCVIEVGDPRLRLSSLSALRFTQAGGLRLT